MSKGGRAALARSRSIDHQLDEERERRQREVQLLLLGGAGSGKSTFIKQLRLHYGDGFPEAERERFLMKIFQNVANALDTLLEQMTIRNLQFEREETKAISEEFRRKHPRLCLKTLLAKFSEEEGGDEDAVRMMTRAEVMSRLGRLSIVNPEKPDLLVVQSIWSDAGVQACYAQRNLFSAPLLTPGELYYLENIDRVCRNNYVPSINDILYIRWPTLGVKEHLFTIDSLNYRIIDVAGQRSLRKKWLHFFDAVTAVIFYASLAGYDEVLEEDETVNNLQDSIQAFHEMTHNHFLEKTDFILFLNKKDLFMEKAKKKSITCCFPEYQGEESPEGYLKYIKDQFLLHKPGHKQAYIHVSTAIDIAGMRQVLTNVVDIIVEINLRRAGTY